MTTGHEDISADKLKALLDDGEIVIFGRRDAETLQRLASFFDINHDDENIKTLKEMVGAWQAWRTLGAAGRLILYFIGGGLAAIAALASITGRWPWLIDLVTGSPPPAQR